MISTNQDRQILILSGEMTSAGFVETVFNEESRKCDLAWTAKSAELASALSTLLPVTSESIGVGASKPDLLIVLVSIAQKGAIEQQLSSYKAPVEFWGVDESATSERELRNQVNRLIVQLVLKGGKRPKLPDAEGHGKSATPGLPQPSDSIKKNATVRVGRERGGRRGKTVTIVSGLPLVPATMTQLCAELKQMCGSGGTAKDGILEIQGDHVEKVMTALLERGYKPKRKGG